MAAVFDLGAAFLDQLSPRARCSQCWMPRNPELGQHIPLFPHGGSMCLGRRMGMAHGHVCNSSHSFVSSKESSRCVWWVEILTLKFLSVSVGLCRSDTCLCYDVEIIC